MQDSPNHHPLVQLARAAIEAYVCDGHVLKPEEAPEPVGNQRAGVFVTIHTRSTGELRGCIGTIEPCEPDIAHETIQNAISAATQDPRFPPVPRRVAGPRDRRQRAARSRAHQLHIRTGPAAVRRDRTPRHAAGTVVAGHPGHRTTPRPRSRSRGRRHGSAQRTR